MKFTRGIQDEPFQAFQPSKQEPKPENIIVDQNTGETLSAKVDRLQSRFNQEIQAAKMKLAQAEEERKRAWRKMEKTKAEYQQSSLAQQSAARFVAPGASRAMPTYQPRRDARGLEGYAPSSSVNTSDSKYSAARVRERVHADGTVEPVNKKKGPDGFYQRPAGRSRKGMEWDPIRGVWVPTGH